MTSETLRVAQPDFPWKSENPSGMLLLISDEQFRRLAQNPNEAVEKPIPWMPENKSLREYCRELQQSGADKLLVAYDYFFGGSTREMFPDMPEFQDNLRRVSDVAKEFGLGIEPSILSPLELGIGYQQRTGERGRWMQYAEGLRDAQSGAFSLEMWKQVQWCNNKGPTPVTLTGVRAFAFREEPVHGTPYFAVNPAEIYELPTPEIESFPGTLPTRQKGPEPSADENRAYLAERVRVFSAGQPHSLPDGAWCNRVLVVLVYATQEMDYFSPSAPDFVTGLADRFMDLGVDIAGIYSDEMHIQQDWSYFSHLDNGQFTQRYVSLGFEREFANRYGEQYADFARWLIYFTLDSHRFLANHEPKLSVQHVFGPSPAEIAATFRFRRDYYHLLEGSVVDLVNLARKRIEDRQGKPIDAFYHSTWAESPTCDAWTVNGAIAEWSPLEHRRKYEYTSEFVWSNTVQQAAAACANNFKWNDFLTGGNNDVPEGGFCDRDYYGRALACSLAAVNRRPLASCGMWGMPAEVNRRMMAVSEAFGALGNPIFRSVQDYLPRSVETLFIYPQDLVAVEERFGSWMVQYGYANYLTAEKLVQYGSPAGGWLEVQGPALTSRYKAVCVLFEPFPAPELIDLLSDFANEGGIVIWSGTPPLQALTGESAALQEKWQALFGIQALRELVPDGQAMPGRAVRFGGALAGTQPMPILTDFLVDRVHPVIPADGAEETAWIQPGGALARWCVGVRKTHGYGGQALFLGFRPRDDQSASTGEDIRTWYEILSALGAYPGADNPVHLSRSSRYYAAQFANGAFSLAPHYTQHVENWRSPFFRDLEVDAKALAENPIPDDNRIELNAVAVGGQSVSYSGEHCLTWKLDDSGRLVAFAGQAATGITLNGRVFRWSETPVDLAWHCPQDWEFAGKRVVARLWAGQSGSLRLPLGLPEGSYALHLGAYNPGGRTPAREEGLFKAAVGVVGRDLPFSVETGDLLITVGEDEREHWLYLLQS